MEQALYDFLWPVTIWHWLAIAAILFGIEMMLGTFDLLLIAVAALVTATWTAFAPGMLGGWTAQLAVFFLTSIVLIVLGRTVLKGLRTGGPGEPALNKRMERMLGARGTAVADFVAGRGRVRIGDTEWSAESADGSDISNGQSIAVDGSRSTVVIVKPV
ncbi:MAG: NfeD family protein [Pseudomonadota bacterium]